jgi:hypothetical protein
MYNSEIRYFHSMSPDSERQGVGSTILRDMTPECESTYSSFQTERSRADNKSHAIASVDFRFSSDSSMTAMRTPRNN